MRVHSVHVLRSFWMFVVLGTKTYAAEGKETIDTKKELAFALREKKEILVLKLTDTYAEAFAVLQLPALQSIDWPVEDSGSVPQAALDHILKRVQTTRTTRSHTVVADGATAAVMKSDAVDEDTSASVMADIAPAATTDASGRRTAEPEVVVVNM